MMLQRLATGATGVKQARRQRGTRTRMRSIYDANVMYVHVRPAYEFRRGFCTLVLSLNLKVILRFFKCMESMARDLCHPYIPSTTVLGDYGPHYSIQ